MASVLADGDLVNSEPLKYKTWVLKVSIHCEGCKRKVKRILHSVEGVYTIDVDTRKHKVVVTGNVDANTLIRKLEKSGKHAELWPGFHKVNQTNEQQVAQNQNQDQNQNQNQNQNPNTEDQKEPQNNNESQKVVENCGQPTLQQQQQQQVKEVRFEGNVAGEPQQPPANGGNDGGGGGGGGGGAKKKKKKKKGPNGNNNTTPNPNNGGENNSNNSNGGDVASGVMEQGPNSGPPCTESHPHPNHHPNPGNMSPPRHQPNNRVYEYSPPYYGPPPIYAVNYNTAYPSSSYSASYYSAPPPYSYAHVHQGGDVEASAPLDWNSHAVPPPSDSFEMFSDENPNACVVI